MFVFLISAAVGTQCQDVAPPHAASEVGAIDRRCFFGSEAAFDIAWYDAMKTTGCRTIDSSPPTCDCPTDPLDPAVCSEFGPNLFRLYSPEPGAEPESVLTLIGRTRAACDTYGGVRLSPEAAANMVPDGVVPACQRRRAGSTPDVAVFTAYITIAALEAAFLIFEFTKNQNLLSD